MNTTRPLVLWTALLVCWGCQNANNTASVSDASVPIDALTDGGMTPAPDAESPQCRWATDCPGGDCIAGICEAPAEACNDESPCPDGESCTEFLEGSYCARPCEASGECPLRPRPCAVNTQCPRPMLCLDGRCVNECVTDLDCEPGHCMDGVCSTYPDILGGSPPLPGDDGEGLRVGVAVSALDYPIGVSMPGFAQRVGPATPYNVSLGGSDGVLEHQDVRVLVLETRDDILILLRLPLGWSTDYLRTLTAVKLQALTQDEDHPKGINYLERLITGATHSHSQAGRYWHILPGLGFGTVGYGEFSLEMVERYTTVFAQTIKRAMDDLQPAQMGWSIIDDFDPEHRIHSNRRGQTPGSLDDRLMVWRIEDAEGRPMAGLVNFAIHGTHMEETWITGDVAGAIERITTDALSARTNAFAPVLFFNGNAGNVSPRGDDGVAVPWGKLQAVGHRINRIFETTWDSIDTRDNVHLEVVHRRIPVTYELLGYDASVPEFRDNSDEPYTYGGFFCVNGDRSDDDPWMDGALNCLLSCDFLGTPVPNVHKTVLSAFRIDDLVVTTLPGEPTSGLGLGLAEAVEADAEQLGFENVRSMNFGYSQDHQLYLIEPDDWFRGGYEAANNWFGWRLGAYLAEASRGLAYQLFTDEKESNETGIKPMWWIDVFDDTVTPTASEAEAGVIISDVEDAIERGQMLQLQWTGGHPGVDLPRVRLEQLVDNEFVGATRASGLPFDDGGFESVTRYLGDYEGNHDWDTRWELPFDVAVGQYQLVAEGRSVIGDEVVPYEVRSQSFSVSATQLVIRELIRSPDGLAFKVNYPDGPSTDDGQSPFDELKPRGYLLRSDPYRSFSGRARRWAFLLGPALNASLPIHIQIGEDDPQEMMGFDDETSRNLVVSRNEAGDEDTQDIDAWPSTRLELEGPVAEGVDVRIEDRFGNYQTIPGNQN